MFQRFLMGMIALGVLFSLTACTKREQGTRADQNQHKQFLQYQHQFEVWEKEHHSKLDEYATYIAQYLKDPPEPFYLAYTGHSMPKQCEIYRFSIPPKKEWKNIVAALKIIEQLQKQGTFQRYQIISTYRSPELNQCVKGAKKSQHMHNYAVDFKVFDQRGQAYQPDQDIEKKLCQFWHAKGHKLNMGFGLYPSHIYHIDTVSFRTWGGNYHQESSPCLQK